MTADEIARAFHEAYERLAPSFGYRTREESAVPWESVPLMNKRLMIATVTALLEDGTIAATRRKEAALEEVAHAAEQVVTELKRHPVFGDWFHAHVTPDDGPVTKQHWTPAIELDEALIRLAAAREAGQ